MKMQDALDIIEKKEKGFMVHFEKREGHLLKSDYFPDKHAGEELISTEDEAWELAVKFAKSTSPAEIINIYVIDNNFNPVKDYTLKANARTRQCSND